VTYGGSTYDPDRDKSRLDKQRADVWRLTKDSRWYTLSEIGKATGHPEASISARLRDFRKAQFGGHTVERVYYHDGLWMYRVIPNTKATT